MHRPVFCLNLNLAEDAIEQFYRREEEYFCTGSHEAQDSVLNLLISARSASNCLYESATDNVAALFSTLMMTGP